jgi:hypothetical protein
MNVGAWTAVGFAYLKASYPVLEIMDTGIYLLYLSYLGLIGFSGKP